MAHRLIPFIQIFSFKSLTTWTLENVSKFDYSDVQLKILIEEVFMLQIWKITSAFVTTRGISTESN